MPDPIKVEPQNLAALAGRVREQADALQAGHRSSAATVDDAQRGLVGRSAQSIDARTRRWHAATADLHRVLTSQADALSNAAAAYARIEENNRREVESLDPTAL